MSLVFHIAEQAGWEAALAAGSYQADTLMTEGFIHCSKAEQVEGTANAFYRGRKGLVLLHIDCDRVEAEIRYENLEGGLVLFPHIYGPLNLDAVVRVEAFTAGANSGTPKITAALFDCDGTLYTAQFGRGMMRYAAEHGGETAVRLYYRSILAPFLLRKFKLIAAEKYLRPVIANLAGLLRDLDEKDCGNLWDWLADDYLLSTCRPEVTARLREHQENGHVVVLVSGSFIPGLERIAERVGASGYAGTQLEVVDGRYSGKIIPPVITGKDKELFTRWYFQDRGIEVDWKTSWAYADSITDLGMLEMAGNPVAVYPEPRLDTLARRRGWEVIGAPR